MNQLAPQIPENELERLPRTASVRSVQRRTNEETGQLEVLMLKRKTGDSFIYELPGGKVFDDDPSGDQYWNEDRLNRKTQRLRELKKELWEETRQKIDLSLKEDSGVYLEFIGSMGREFDPGDEYRFEEDGLAYQGIKTHYYTFESPEYDPSIDCSQDPDNEYIGFEWIALDDLADEELRTNDFFRKTTRDISPLMFGRLRSIVNRDVNKVVSTFVDDSDGIVKGPCDGGGQSSLDISHDVWSMVSARNRRALLEAYFGEIEEEGNIEELQLALRYAVAYESRHRGKQVDHEIRKTIQSDFSPELVRDIMYGKLQEPEESEQWLTLFKVARSVISLRKQAPWFFDASVRREIEEQFKKTVGELCPHESFAFRPFKELYRVLDKLLTKSDFDVRQVRDPIGFKVVVADIGEVKAKARKLKRELGCDKAKKDLQRFSFTDTSKEDFFSIDYKNQTTNVRRGDVMRGAEYLVGNFGGVNFEGQVITQHQERQQEAELGSKEVYRLLKNSAIRDGRLDGPILKDKLQSEMSELAMNPRVQNSFFVLKGKVEPKQRRKVGRRLTRGDAASTRVIAQTYARLEGEVKECVFDLDKDHVYAYQEVLRNWDSPLSPDNPKYQQKMFANLNKRIQFKLSSEEWRLFFTNQDAFRRQFLREDSSVERYNVLLKILAVADKIPKFKLSRDNETLLSTY